MSDMNRRVFLGTMGAAGAAALAPFMDGPAFAQTAPVRLFTVAVAGRDKDINEAKKDLNLDIRVTFNVAHTETFAKMNAACSRPSRTSCTFSSHSCGRWHSASGSCPSTRGA